MRVNTRRVRFGEEEEERKKRKEKRKKKKEDVFCLDSNGFGFICAGVSNVGGYTRNA